ncbi:hypothetical protein M8494_07620 [Serratia ureilytica]
MEKALAHILASDAGLKTILNSCRSSPRQRTTRIDLDEARIHLIGGSTQYRPK